MSITSRAVPSRGASVLAALVLAAIMASVALLVQGGSPVAVQQRTSQAAEAAAPSGAMAVGAGKDGQIKLSNPCVPGYDYSIELNGDKKPETTKKPVCRVVDQGLGTASVPLFNYPTNPTADIWAKDAQNGRCSSDGKPQGGWKCVIRDCSGLSEGKPCQYSYADKGAAAANSSTGGGSVPSAAELTQLARLSMSDDADVSKDATDRLDKFLAGNPANQAAIDRAFSEAYQEDLADKARTAAEDYNKAEADLAALGGTDFAEECSAVYGPITEKCSKALAAQKRFDQAADEYDRIAKEYADLKDNSTALGPDEVDTTAVDECLSSGNMSANCAQVVGEYCESWNDPSRCGSADPTKNSGKSCPPEFSGQPPYCSPGNGNGSFPGPGNGDRSAAQRAAQQQAAQQAAQRAAQQQAAQQAAQQQQCQPRYQCNTSGTASVVMYNQCPQQNAPWQTYQQCPTGYSCQNNGCVATAQYGYCADGRTPRTGPAQQQPPASSCTVGSWVDQSNGCQTSWQCIAGNATSTSGTNPTAQLSCQPQTTISGATTTMAYACANGATKATGTNFSINPSSQLSGSTSTVTTKPADGSTSVTYTLTCANENVSPALTASAQCSVRVGNPAIVLVATPDTLSKTATADSQRKSTIGWVTTGMQSCVISNADFADWTTQQASITSISGAVTSPIIPASTSETIFKLTCQTLAGTTASSTVKVKMQ